MKKCVKIFALVTAVMLAVLAMASCDVIAGMEGSLGDLVSGILPCEHSWVEASCKEAKHCELCGETEGELGGHVSEVVSGYAATCTATGLTDGAKCSVCGEVIEGQTVIPVAAHTPKTVAGYAPTCDVEGKTDGVSCSACGEVITAQQSIPTVSHTLVILRGYSAGCTTEGKTDGVGCGGCGEVILAQETIPQKGHAPEVVKGYAATCTAAGLSDGEKCGSCGEITVAQEVIPAGDGHTEGPAATCTTDQVCTECGEVIVEKHHTPESVNGYDSDCENTGLTDGVSCGACGEVLTAQETIPAKGHTDGAKETCTTDKVCTECGGVLVEKHHTPEDVIGYDPDCENTGLTDGVSCGVCGEVIIAQQPIPENGHTEGAKETCTTDQTCTVCGAVLVEKHHTPKVVKGYAATCTATGLTDGESCDACGEILVEREVIPAKGHTEGPAETCTTNQICTVCRVVLVEKHHTPATVSGYAAGCLDDGLTDGVSCSACGEVLTAQETIPATGHSFEVGVCTGCGQEYFNEGMIFRLSNDGKYYIADSVGNITDKDIIIPATYKGLPVREIGGDFAKMSSNRELFETVTIPSSIKLIRNDLGSREGPFYGCVNLKKVYIDSLDSWFDTTIYNVDGANPLYYGAELYAGGALVTEVTIPDRIEQIIDIDWFWGCSSITKINFHDKVYVIDEFKGLTNLTEITIPSSVKIVLGGAFQGCTSLATISIPDKTYQIFSGAFWNTAYYNDEANWDESGVLYVGKHLLKAKNTIEGSYTVKADTTSIAGGAFEGCSKLTGLTLNSGLVVIGNNAFYSTSQLTSLTIPYSVRYIGFYAFDGMAGSINNGYGRDITFEYTGQWYDMGDFYQNLSSPNYIYGTRSSTGVIYYVNQQPIMGGDPSISVQDGTCTYALCR